MDTEMTLRASEQQREVDVVRMLRVAAAHPTEPVCCSVDMAPDHDARSRWVRLGKLLASIVGPIAARRQA